LSAYKFIFRGFNKLLLSSALLLTIAPGGRAIAEDSVGAVKTSRDETTVTTTKTTSKVRRKHDDAKRESKTENKVENKAENKAMDGKPAAAGASEPAADNTGTNKRDRADRAVTADQQKNDKSDVELAAEIRRAVVDDKSLSTNAHNVKIIVVAGQVTLKGPVASQAEKATVEKLAREHVGHGKGRVTSELDVAP
jgi:osmotically-inducible protein OsmY